MIQKLINSTLAQELKSNIIKYGDCVPADRVLPLWVQNMNAMKREILTNPNVNIFLQFPTIYATMFVGNCPAIKLEYDKVMRSVFKHKWQKAMEETTIGCPTLSDIDSNTSGNLIHTVCHLHMFEDNTNAKIENMDMVFEYGGGYGSMARAIYQAGFSGKYLLYDLPVFACIQNCYLKALGYNVETINVASQDKDVYAFFDTDNLERQMLNFHDCKNKLFVATWSLSESPMTIRNIIVEMLKKYGFNYFLISSMTHWQDIDNVKFFTELDIPGVQFKVVQNEIFIPNFYVFGSPK